MLLVTFRKQNIQQSMRITFQIDCIVIEREKLTITGVNFVFDVSFIGKIFIASMLMEYIGFMFILHRYLTNLRL